MVNLAGVRKQASKCSSLWAESSFHRGSAHISVWPKFIGKNAQEQRITRAICKHVNISRTRAFVRNKVNYCQIKLIFVQKYNDIHLTNKKEADEIYLHFHKVPVAASHGIFTKKMGLYEIISACQCMTRKPYQRVFINDSSSDWKDVSRHFGTIQYFYNRLSHFESCDQDVRFEALPGPVTVLSRPHCSAATCNKCLSLQRPTESTENHEWLREDHVVG